jgi:hypothetical protein
MSRWSLLGFIEQLLKREIHQFIYHGLDQYSVQQ